MAGSEDLKVQLEEACDGLWWSSESDYPVEVVWAKEDAGSQDLSEGLSEKLSAWLLSNVERIEHQSELVAVDINDFFERSLAPKSWHTTEDKAQIQQLRQLKELLVRSLHPLQVYRYGEVEVLVYVLGCTESGNIAGVKTCLVET